MHIQVDRAAAAAAAAAAATNAANAANAVWMVQDSFLSFS